MVFPILEEFVAENFKRGTASMAKLNELDSIVVKDLPLIVVEEYDGNIIQKNYGLHYRVGNRHWIEIDSSLLQDSIKFEYTLTHELGHVFGLPHIPANPDLKHPDNRQIMCGRKFIYYVSREDLQQAKSQFYDSLKSIQ